MLGNKQPHRNKINRADIINDIKLLEKIKQHFRGVQQQKTAFYKIVDDLRRAYRFKPQLFSKLDIKMIKHLIDYVKNYQDVLDFNTQIELHKICLNELPKGTVVLHKMDYYVGVVVDSKCKTESKTYKNPSTEREYRIFISAQEVRHASSFDLNVIGSSTISQCFKCNGLISIFSQKCVKCRWRICSHCNSCNCNNNPHFRTKAKPLGGRITKLTLGQQTMSQCVNCLKFDTELCPGPSETMGSYSRMVTFCSAYSPRSKNY